MGIPSTSPIEGTPERIENANGTAIKFRDGTMICTKQITKTIDITRTWGTIFIETTGSGVQIGNFAAEFVGNPTISIMVTTDSSFSVGPLLSGNNMIMSLWRATSATGLNCTVHVTAIGRWK